MTATGKQATLTLTKHELDKLVKDKKDKLVPKGFALELQMAHVAGPEVGRERTLTLP